jgi:hypothetical protein
MSTPEKLKLVFPLETYEIVDIAERKCVHMVMSVEAILEMTKGSKLGIRQAFKKQFPNEYSSEWEFEKYLASTPEGDKYWLGLLDNDGGCEGDGEFVQRIIGLFKYDGDMDIFVGSVEITGAYCSYDGTTWDHKFNEVIAKPKLVINWVDEGR